MRIMLGMKERPTHREELARLVSRLKLPPRPATLTEVDATETHAWNALRAAQDARRPIAEKAALPVPPNEALVAELAAADAEIAERQGQLDDARAQRAAALSSYTACAREKLADDIGALERAVLDRLADVDVLLTAANRLRSDARRHGVTLGQRLDRAGALHRLLDYPLKFMRGHQR